MVTRSNDVQPYDQAAQKIYDLIDHLDDFVREGEHTLVERAAAALGAFEAMLKRSGVAEATLQPARYALAVLIDQKARMQPRLKLSTWSVLSQQKLFDGRDMSLVRIQDFQRTAAGAGQEYAGLAEFLDDVLARAQDKRSVQRRVKSNWGLISALCVAGFVACLVSYACFLEYRFHQRITESFRQELIAIGLDRNPQGADLAERLTQLAKAKSRVQRAASFAPLRRAVRLPVIDSETIAETAYADALQTHVPPAILAALEDTLATAGGSLDLYDALRALAVLKGDTDWTPAYLRGWFEDNQDGLGWAGFAEYAAALSGPDPELAAIDQEVLDQAREFASEAVEFDRVWLELKRSEGAQALADWQPDAEVAGLGEILLRRSGKPLSRPIAGLYTIAGWEYARDFGVGVAVQDARRLAPVILGMTPPPVNQTPDQVQNRLHSETIDVWTAWLADLRVQPFNNRDRAILVSGSLSQRTNPLTQLLSEVWVQAGGKDRKRSHAQQIELGRVFGPMIQYVEQGGMERIGRLFSSLNVALGSIDIDKKRGVERLMSVQDRARSVNVLQTAPLIVVQIAEDVLAQTSAAQNDEGGDPLTAGWQSAVYPLCRAALEGVYPFADGPDAVPADVQALLSATGPLMQFYQSYAAPFIDQSASPWRWKPEARFSGLDPESAAFFERAVFVSQALFDGSGGYNMPITLAALAERGNTVFALGGTGAPVRATGDPATLAWPGPDPAMGVEVSFREGSDGARIAQPGFWGLLRLLDQFRLRFRDEGQRVLVDLRTNEGRVFVEMGFNAAANPVSGRAAFRDFSCPPQL